MPKAVTDHTTTSRRTFVGGAGAVALTAALMTGPPLAAAQEPDSELIQLCGEFEALQRRILDFYTGGATWIVDDDEREVAIAPFEEQQDELAHRIYAMRATTLAGFRALASAYVAWKPDSLDPDIETDYVDERLLARLMRDMTGAA